MTLDPSVIRVIAFDVMNTVIDASPVPKDEIAAYVSNFGEVVPKGYSVPESWKALKARPDSAEGIRRLRKRFKVVTCSNVPAETLKAMSERNGIQWDRIVDVPAFHFLKPQARAYWAVSETTGVWPEGVLMVTANPRMGRFPYGDREYATVTGMKSVLIRGESDIPDIIALAERLGC